MSLNDDLLKHTMFLQRYAVREQQTIMKNVKEIAKRAKLVQHQSLKNRNKLINDKAAELSQDIEKLYEYERKFIRKLLKKYGKDI